MESVKWYKPWVLSKREPLRNPEAGMFADLDPWLVKESDFPSDGSDSDKLRFLVSYAVLAPSGHNTQPWLFRLTNDEIWLYADRVRELPVVDPDHRELIISCGAALFNLRSAIRHFGYEDIVQILPDPRNASLIAIVKLGNRRESSECEKLLFSSITRRRTNRNPYINRMVPESLLRELENEAAEEGVRFYVVSDECKPAIGDLVAEADAIQWSDPEFRKELVEWIRPSSAASDGIPSHALGFGKLMGRLGPLLIRYLDMGKGQGARNRRLIMQSPVIAVIETENDTPDDWVPAGQALERVLLRARADDVWVSYFNQAVEVPEVRQKLAQTLVMRGIPQLLLRLGYGLEVRPTPRRPMIEVIR